MEKLKKAEDILFYDEIDLFEDELADNGTAILNVKIVSVKFQGRKNITGIHLFIWTLCCICSV